MILSRQCQPDVHTLQTVCCFAIACSFGAGCLSPSNVVVIALAPGILAQMVVRYLVLKELRETWREN